MFLGEQVVAQRHLSAPSRFSKYLICFALKLVKLWLIRAKAQKLYFYSIMSLPSAVTHLPIVVTISICSTYSFSYFYSRKVLQAEKIVYPQNH
jgi:hypothetical protein